MGTNPKGQEELVAAFREGKIGALARAISRVEEGREEAFSLLETLQAPDESCWRTGITGPPGAGKSTFAGALARAWVEEGRRTALLAVDPSSEVTGGALLGDRIRMASALENDGVFVRSMASRGSLGGLGRAVGAAADLCTSFGFHEVLLETVGVGQAETDVASQADLVVVVLHPRSGDGIQAMKAGLLETADLLLVNKSDTQGAGATVRDLEGALDLVQDASSRPPVLCCSALDGGGMVEVLGALDSLREGLSESGVLEDRRTARSLARARRIVGDGLRRRAWAEGGLEARTRRLLDEGVLSDRAAGEVLEGALARLSEVAS